MGHIIEQLTSSPLHLVIGGILAIILVFGIIKKITKLIIILGVALVTFLGYLHFTGQEIPSNADELKDSIKHQVDQVKE